MLGGSVSLGASCRCPETPNVSPQSHNCRVQSLYPTSSRIINRDCPACTLTATLLSYLPTNAQLRHRTQAACNYGLTVACSSAITTRKEEGSEWGQLAAGPDPYKLQTFPSSNSSNPSPPDYEKKQILESLPTPPNQRPGLRLQPVRAAESVLRSLLQPQGLFVGSRSLQQQPNP